MIRNYYTDAFKSGISVTPSDTLLLDGRAKATTPISYWKEYNIYIGTSPIQQDNFGGNTSATANQANTGQAIITIKVDNPRIQPGMTVHGTNVPAGATVLSVQNSKQFTLSANIGTQIAADTVLTFSFAVLPAIKVQTINNETITFTNPVAGSILPVSVVQVYSTDTQGGVTDIVALS
tara:strand:+ start:429 stop:962 length:534 start_codon:yes stop_codon:yes gene_type:complete